MDLIETTLRSMLERLTDIGPELLAASLVFGLLLVIGRAIAAAVARVASRRDPGTQSVRLLVRLIRLGFGLLGLVLGLQILGLTAVATSLLATGGLFAVILGFAFREIGENLLAGLFLGVSRSFEVGDLIESAGYTGKVREIDLRQVWIRSADGRDIFVPSAEILRNPLVNYTRDDLRRGEFVVGIDYAEDVEGARTLLLRHTAEVADVLPDPEPSVRISEFAPQYCELKVYFWVNTEGPAGLSEVRSRVMAACLGALKEEGYTLSSDVSTAVSLSDTRGSARSGG